jgi:hypothetical protein
MCRRKGYAGKDRDIPGRVRKKELKLTGEVGIELCNCNFPFCRLLLQARQFGMGVGGISLGGEKQLLGFFELALQKLGDPVLQLLYLDLVSGIPVVQLLGHIH